MRKISLILTILFLGTSFLVVNAEAVNFSLSEAALLQLWEIDESPVSGPTSLLFITADPGVYGGTMIGNVGFVGSLYSSSGSSDYPFAWMQIGANSTGVSPALGTTGATSAQVIGGSLGMAPTSSLVGFDIFTMNFGNDNDDNWMVSLYLHTGAGETNKYQTSWITLLPDTDTTLSVDLTGVAELNNVTNIGFYIKANLTGKDGNPSNPDIFHLSSSAELPEPGSWFLMGVGLFGLVIITNTKSRLRKTITI
jgi:hypothetical protein